MRPLLPALLIAVTAAAASAQTLSDGPLAKDPMTCAAYEALDNPRRVDALRGIEPFGDEIGAEDDAASIDWANEVAKHCHDMPDRSLTEAAQLANQSIEAQ